MKNYFFLTVLSLFFISNFVFSAIVFNSNAEYSTSGIPLFPKMVRVSDTEFLTLYVNSFSLSNKDIRIVRCSESTGIFNFNTDVKVNKPEFITCSRPSIAFRKVNSNPVTGIVFETVNLDLAGNNRVGSNTYFAYSLNGGASYENVPVNHRNNYFEEHGYPAIAMDSSGNCLVAWCERGEIINRWKIKMTLFYYGSNGYTIGAQVNNISMFDELDVSALGPSFDTRTTGVNPQVSLAWGNDGRFHIIFRAGETEALTRLVHSSWSALTKSFSLPELIDNGELHCFDPQISFDHNGNRHIVYTGGNDSEAISGRSNRIFYKFENNNPVIVVNNMFAFDYSKPSIQTDYDGNAYVSYLSDTILGNVILNRTLDNGTTTPFNENVSGSELPWNLDVDAIPLLLNDKYGTAPSELIYQGKNILCYSKGNDSKLIFDINERDVPKFLAIGLGTPLSIPNDQRIVEVWNNRSIPKIDSLEQNQSIFIYFDSELSNVNNTTIQIIDKQNNIIPITVNGNNLLSPYTFSSGIASYVIRITPDSGIWPESSNLTGLKLNILGKFVQGGAVLGVVVNSADLDSFQLSTNPQIEFFTRVQISSLQKLKRARAFPNPVRIANPEITFKFFADGDPSEVQIHVYDSYDRRIGEVNGPLNGPLFPDANAYSIGPWNLIGLNGSRLRNGTYYYKVVATDNDGTVSKTTGKFSVLR